MLRKRTYENNCFKVYSIVLGKCYEAMKAKLEGQDNWIAIHEEHDLVKLLKSIKVWMLNQQSDRSPVLSTYHAMAALFKTRQQRHEELPELRKRFIAAAEVLQHIGVSLGGALNTMSDGIISDDHKKSRESATTELIKRAEMKALDRMLAVSFIQSADRARYQQVAVNLENEFRKNNNQYPCDITAAYNMLTNWKHSTALKDHPVSDGVNFAQEA